MGEVKEFKSKQHLFYKWSESKLIKERVEVRAERVKIEQALKLVLALDPKGRFFEKHDAAKILDNMLETCDWLILEIEKHLVRRSKMGKSDAN